MAFKDGKINRRDLLRHLGTGALLASPLVAAPEKAEAFFNALLLQKKAGSGAGNGPIASMYSQNTYTGNGGTLSVTTLANMDTDGGLLWIKRRDGGGVSHALFDTARGASNLLMTDQNVAATSGHAMAITSTGFTMTSTSTTNYNASAGTYVAWSFKRTPKFFDLSTVTKTAGSNATVDFSALGTLGMVFVKRTDSTGSWYTWHKDMAAGKLLLMGTTTESTMSHVVISGTTVTLTDTVIADGNYVIYAWAHDTSPTGKIFCGSLANGFSGGQAITTGWEPQYFTYVGSGYGNWAVFDTARGLTSGTQKYSYYNTNAAEGSLSNQPYPTATGMMWTGGLPAQVFYIAIRKP